MNFEWYHWVLIGGVVATAGYLKLKLVKKLTDKKGDHTNED